jgi:hypothetical protein
VLKSILALLAGVASLLNRFAAARERADAKQEGRTEVIAAVNGDRARSAEEGARRTDEIARIEARRDTPDRVAGRMRDGTF